MAAAPALEAILRKRGDLTPEIVVDEASDPGHELHGHFNWDDPSAAHERRLDQAEQLIRSVKVTRIVDEGTDRERSVRVRAYIAERDLLGKDSARGRYVPVERVAQDERLREAALSSMRREWMALQRKYAAFEEFAEMVRADLGEESAA